MLPCAPTALTSESYRLSLHDALPILNLCDRVYAMDVGRVIAEGTPTEIRANPLVVSSYLGTDERAIGRSGRSAPRSRKKRADGKGNGKVGASRVKGDA